MSGIMDGLMQARFDAYDDMMQQGCFCQPGRDPDGSEFGACSYCEEVARLERIEAAPVQSSAEPTDGEGTLALTLSAKAVS